MKGIEILKIKKEEIEREIQILNEESKRINEKRNKLSGELNSIELESRTNSYSVDSRKETLSAINIAIRELEKALKEEEE